VAWSIILSSFVFPQEARRLFAEVNRPNYYIKIAGTTAGIPAIEQLCKKE